MVRILLDQPQAARFLVRKLYRYFISETHDPPAALLEPLAESFRKSDYDIAALMKTILRLAALLLRVRLSAAPEVSRRVRPRRGAGGGPWTEEQDTVRLPPGPLVNRMAAMGQDLFAPPNVKGWPHGKAWLNTSTVLARQQLRPAGGLRPRRGRSVRLSRLSRALFPRHPPPAGSPSGPEPEAVYDPADLVKQAKLTEPAKVVDFLIDLFLQGDAPAPARAKLVAFVAEGKPKDKALDRRIREAAHTIMCMPEYQLA